MSIENLMNIASIGSWIILFSVICVATVSIVKKEDKPKRILIKGLFETAAFAVAQIGATLLIDLTSLLRNENISLLSIDPPSASVQLVYGYDVLHSIYLALLYFICFMGLTVLWKGVAEKAWIKEYLLYILIPVYQLILITVYFAGCSEIGQQELKVGLVLTAFSLFINYCIVYLVNGTLKKIQAERELKTLNEQRQIEAKYYEMTQQNVKEMKELRQDYGNQLQQIYTLLENGENVKDIQKLIDASNEKMKSSAIKRYCENSIVNAILAMKLKSAEEKGIKVECGCNIAEDLKVEMIDLCSLFTNLIDNAVEACELMAADADKWLRIHAGERGGFFLVKVENTYSQPVVIEKGQIMTGKKDKKNHGYGLRLVKEITEKYDGALNISTNDNIFSTLASIFSGGGRK